MNISSLWVSIQADVTQLLQGLNQAQEASNNAGTQAEQDAARVKAAWGGVGTAIAAGLGVALGVLFKASDEIHRMQNQLQASLGLTTEETKNLGNVAKEVFYNNFGESITEVGETIGEIRRQIQGLSNEDLKTLGSAAFALKDTFGVEANEFTAAVKTLMTQFGLSAQQASDFVSKGFQSGLDASGDLLDSINEYGPQFATMKLSAAEMFSAFKTGAMGGTLGIDKAGDAFKEFNIRIKDGSKSTTEALGAIGLSATKMSEDIASGKLTEGQAFQIVQDKLKGLDDAVEQNAVGTALLGSQWEDLGAKAVLSIDLTNTSLADMSGATDELNVKYDDLGNAAEGMKRRIAQAFEPVGESLLSLINAVMPYVDAFVSAVVAIGDAFTALPEPVRNTITAVLLLTATVGTGLGVYAALAPMIGGISGAFTALKATLISTVAVVRTSAMSIAASISAAIWPITIAVAAIGGLYLAYRSNFLGIRDFLKPVIDNIIKYFTKIVDGVKFVQYNADVYWKAFLDGFRLTASTIGQIVKGIGQILGGVGLILYGNLVEPWVPTISSLQTAASSVANGIRNLVNKIGDMLRPVFSILSKLGISIGDALQNAISIASGAIGNLFGSAVNDIKAKGAELARESSTAAKGVKMIEDGINNATNAAKNFAPALANIGKTAQANLKAVPMVNVVNSAVPNAPTFTAPTPVNTNTGYNPSAYVGADPSEADSKAKEAAAKKAATAADKAAKAQEDAARKAEEAARKQAEADRKAAEEARKRKEAIQDNVTALKRLIEENKRTVAAGKMTTDGAIRYRNSIDDLNTRIQRLGIGNDKTIASLLKSGLAYKSVAMEAGKAKEANQAAIKTAQDKKKADDAANKAVTDNVKALKDLLSKQKNLVASGRLTTQQANDFAAKVHDTTVTIDNAGISNNKLIKSLLGSATAYIATSDATAKSNVQKAAQKKLDEDLKKRIDNLKKVSAEYSDEELASKIALIEKSKDYGKEKLLEILHNEEIARTAKLAGEGYEDLTKGIDSVIQSWKDLADTIDDFNRTTAETEYDSRVDSLNNLMDAELAAVGDNEEAALEIKKSYAPKLLALAIEKAEDERDAKLSKLKDTYEKEKEAAEALGNDTTELEYAYQKARIAINTNTVITIAGLKSKSAIDIANQQIALDKKVAEEKVKTDKEVLENAIKINNTLADETIKNYTDGTSEANTAQLAFISAQLQTYKTFFDALGEEGKEAADKIGEAIKNVNAQTVSLVKAANTAFSNTAKELKGLQAEFESLLLDPNSKQAFVNQGVSGFDALIQKYIDLIAVVDEAATVLEGAGDTEGAAPMRAQIKELQGLLGAVKVARASKSATLGTEFDANAKKAADEAAKEREDKRKAEEASIKATEDSITNFKINNEIALADFRVNKLQGEKALKLSMAKNDAERQAIELDYIEKITQAQAESIVAKHKLEMETQKQAMEGELAKEGLTIEQQNAIKAAYEDKARIAGLVYDEELFQIRRNADEAKKAQLDITKAWKTAIENFVKEMASAISGAYATIYENTKKFKSGGMTAEEAAKANGEAASSAGTSIFTAAMTGLKTVLPEFAFFIDIISGLLSKMPQLGIVFQRVGEIFLLIMDLLEPFIQQLATTLEPLLNIIKVMLETIIKPLLPVLTFFLKVTSAIITAIYNVIKTVWNAIAGFLNSIDLFGWKPNLTMLPELEGANGANGANTPSVGAGATGGTGTGSGGQTTRTENRTANVTIYVNEASNVEEVARLVEKKIIKALR